MTQQRTILVVGGGGREHALAWKIAQSGTVGRVLVAPGNAGTATEPKCENVAVAADDVEALLALARAESVHLSVIGPEAPLAAGIVDRFREQGLRCFGPTCEAAQLEASKAFCKDFLERHGIPTAAYRVHSDADTARADIESRTPPIVVKADGLAAGKGVVIAATHAEAVAAATQMLRGESLGGAGRRVVVEDHLEGEEASFIVLAAPDCALEFASSQDHKRIFDGDRGPNTGGMGAYSPAPVVTDAVHGRIIDEVITPTLAGLRRDGVDYTGFLYAGLMIGNDGAPRVLEYNCRLGDPETQPLLMRLRSDLVALMDAALDGRLDTVEADWDPRPALGVVLAAEGYPGRVRSGDAIEGLEAAAADGAKVFHAGTSLAENRAVTSGGRVLCVTAIGQDIAGARDAAYAAAGHIRWPGLQLRRDIGQRAIGRLARG